MARGKKTYEIDMCRGAILPKLLRFSLPLMLSSILQLLFNAADIVVVGRFAGDNALAAVGSTAPVINMLVNVFIGLSVGANILAARCYGARDEAALHQTIHTAILLAMISGVVLSAVGICCTGGILVLMGSPDNVRELATLYLRLYFVGMPAMLCYNFGAALLRAAGDTRRPLYYLTLAGVVNVGLNLIFVIVLHMSVAGVALATVIAQVISAVLVLRCMIRDTGVMHLDLRRLKIWPVRLKQIVKVGLPAGLQNSLFSLSNVVIQSSVNSMGEVIVAGAAAAANIEGFVYSSMNAFYQGTVSFISQNMGAGRYERIRPIMWRALGCVMVTGILIGGSVVLFRESLIGIYSENEAVIAAGAHRLVIVCTLYFFCGMMEVMSGVMRGMGYAITPMIVSLLGACCLRILWVMTVFRIPAFHMVDTIYLSWPISWVLTFTAHCICVAMAGKRLRKQLNE